jgi:SPOR domain
MADNHNQRPYRSNEAPARNAPAAAASSAGDPLAELARLIGQNDPFSEFGRNNVRRGAVPQEPEPATDWAATPAAQMPPPESHQPYPDSSYAAGTDRYPSEPETPEYPAAQAGGYEANAFQLQQMQQDGEQEEFYDDVPPPRRRMGIMAIAAVFALAVIGTAGAFGYRALFGYSGPSQPPPVIKADTAPSKVVPANAGKAPNKLIYDRLADHAQGEKVVSREEQPIDMKPPSMAGSREQDSAQPMTTQAALGSGVISSEPKKIRTITIHPGREAMAEPHRVPAEPVPPPSSPRTTVAAPVQQSAPPQVASNVPTEANPEESPARRRTEARAAPPVHRAAAPEPSNAPLSLNPNANDAAPAARPPMRTASAPARTASTQSAPPASGSYAVQVSSQRSEADAQASFRSLQAKYPNQLGGRQATIHRVELGAKGTYYRALVGPFASANEANALCSDLKAAGGQCLIQRN